ncbi:translation initiation factor IF-2 [Capnocytophaga granulosa]|jgi:translation initiation factor IF-2|uniref:Translation initiation factor IF-2 n=1 Tax=Capnocytophaga granulosa TaxID=45242 RepID=A0A1H2RP45_9FLAO|nr:translation initiation factor IF-2 [Capnocytophaga granulosa]EPD30107.1 translation initiation factor IF-2 [Capnocytophaga granulosa ATCC 51502]SDW21065.1 translation initiation factor IF-2 [Capnocytophaga granulosa]SUX20745.1 Translation initiation factor IF-2 [Capnocytophaga granulosa]
MAEDKRLNKAAKEYNISTDRVVEFLKSKGHTIDPKPNTKIPAELIALLEKEFGSDKKSRETSKEITQEQRREKEAIRQELLEKERQEKAQKEQEIIRAKATIAGAKVVGKIDLDQPKKATPQEVAPQQETTPKEKTASETPAVVEKEVHKEPALEENHSDKHKDKDKNKHKDKDKDKKDVKSPLSKQEKDLKNKSRELLSGKPILSSKDAAKKEEKKPQIEPEPGVIETKYTKLTGPKLVGEKIDLSQFERPKKKKNGKDKDKNKDAASGDKQGKRKRKRISSEKENTANPNAPKGGNSNNKDNKDKNKNKKKDGKIFVKTEPTEEEVQKQVRETLEKLQGKSVKSKGAKYRKEKRDSHRHKSEEEIAQQERESTILRVTEFVTVNELSTMMDVPVNKVIGACMSLGIFVTMNQRLDAETLAIVADEFGFQIEFSTAGIDEAIPTEEDRPEDLVPRAPIVTVMGHVDHGKTSLLDHIRNENVIAGESGGITQHIGAYSVTLKRSKQRITFLDTPGHEAFTAMRARGAQITDIAIIVIAADDDIMPQTKEAISHAQAAGVPIIFAINKIDKPAANPERIKEHLANMNLLVEEWGGKIQSQDISAKKGIGVSDLLDKVLLEAEILELRANPNKRAVGTIVEAALDKGRGYVSTVLVQEGTLKIGDYVLAGTHSGKIRAMQDERGRNVKEAIPSTPVTILGLDGAPQAGDKFYVFEDEKEAKQIAAKRTQLLREQSVRTQRHITLDEIGRRIALGDFKELNIILKGDVDGSVEALTDSFQKLSTEEIQISIIHKGVGAITESDVLLASASNAIIVGFNVRPMANARALAEKEEIDIRTYSIIYDAINDLKDAMEGMLSPEMREEVTGTVEIRELFKISKVGTIAGCMVTDGKIYRNSKIRLLRENVVIYTGELSSLKRFKDDVKEVSKGYDCGLQIKNYNDIKEGDIIEAFQEVAVKKKL